MQQPRRSTRKASRHTGRTSGTKQFEARMHDEIEAAVREHLEVRHVTQDRRNWEAVPLGHPRIAVQLFRRIVEDGNVAPAAARIGACCPPPDARQRTWRPATSSHSRGTGLVGVSTISHRPLRAASIASGDTGTVHSLPCSTSASQAMRLCSRTSLLVPLISMPAETLFRRSRRS